MSEEERQAIIHLLDKQARYEYCIENNISFSDEDYEAYIIKQSMINKDKEIDRLNNIINELEKYINKLMGQTRTAIAFNKGINDIYETKKYERDNDLFEMILDKLKKLKEDK